MRNDKEGNYDILITTEKIKSRIKELAKRIEQDYKDKEPLFVCVLKGAFIFCSDIIREIDLPISVEFVKISTYKGKSKDKSPEIFDDINVKDKDIIILDEIIDSGETAKFLREYFLSQGAKSVNLCILLIKERKRKLHLLPRYVGFEIPDVFVAGYGLDYNERYREFPFIIRIL